MLTKPEIKQAALERVLRHYAMTERRSEDDIDAAQSRLDGFVDMLIENGVTEINELSMKCAAYLRRFEPPRPARRRPTRQPHTEGGTS